MILYSEKITIEIVEFRFEITRIWAEVNESIALGRARRYTSIFKGGQ